MKKNRCNACDCTHTHTHTDSFKKIGGEQL